MRVEIFTIFPELVSTWAGASLIGKAWRNGALEIVVHDLRAGANEPHRSVDDSPFGGGAGMVLAPEPVFSAVEAARPGEAALLARAGRAALRPGAGPRTGRTAPVSRCCAEGTRGSTSGWRSTSSTASCRSGITSWREERRRPSLWWKRWPDWSRASSATRSPAEEESFADSLLEYPQYTRPAQFREWPVPEVLLSGHHEQVARWRRAAALARTLERRPDLIAARGRHFSRGRGPAGRMGFRSSSLN